MEVKQVVRIAKNYVQELLSDEGIVNLGLEEIEFNEREDAWHVTLGFSRPWNTQRSAVTVITGEPAPRRAYRVLRVRDSDGQVLSFRQREAVD